VRLLRLPAALLLAGLLVGADAESKSWASSDLRRRGPRAVIEGHLVWRFQLNSGIAFGLFQDSLDPRKGPLLIAYSAVMTGGLALLLGLRLLRRQRPGWLVPGGLLLLLAGTAGNLLDRIRLGAVIDFIDLTLFGVFRWPAFNLADAYLAVGVVLCATGLGVALVRDARERADAATARAR
jgi:signal peptidase II